MCNVAALTVVSLHEQGSRLAPDSNPWPVQLVWSETTFAALQERIGGDDGSGTTGGNGAGDRRPRDDDPVRRRQEHDGRVRPGGEPGLDGRRDLLREVQARADRREWHRV